MSHAYSRTVWPALAALLVPACGSGDAVNAFITETAPLDVRQPDRVVEAARSSDPAWILSVSTMPVDQMYDAAWWSSGCPLLVEHSDAAAGIVDWRIEGDCHDEANDIRYEGSIVARGNPEEGTEIEYRDFRKIGPSESSCPDFQIISGVTGVSRLPFPYDPGWSGEEASMLAEPDRSGRYDVHALYELQSAGLVEGICRGQRNEMAYDVTLDLAVEDFAERFDIDGRVAVRTLVTAPGEPWVPGIPSPGAWRVTARDYGRGYDEDGACQSFMTGTLRLGARGDVAALSANPTDSCLDEGRTTCAPWSVNGAEQPEPVCEFAQGGCSAGPDAPPPWLALGIVLTGLLWQGYRRRRQRS